MAGGVLIRGGAPMQALTVRWRPSVYATDQHAGGGDARARPYRFMVGAYTGVHADCTAGHGRRSRGGGAPLEFVWDRFFSNLLPTLR